MKSLRYITVTLYLFALVPGACTKQCTVATTPVVVNAGIYDTVVLPKDSITLAGEVKSGLTGNTAYLWTLVSGPSVPAFSNNTSLSTVITGLVAGRYVLQLQATNSNGTGLDTTSVVITPQAVKTLVLEPGQNPNELVITQWNGADYESGPTQSFIAGAWTKSGLLYNMRMIVKFDFSAIPVSADILSAHLFLYSNPTPNDGNFIDANYGTSNSFVMQQITSPWTASAVTWSNQPAVTVVNQAEVAATNLSFLDVDVDITAMVASMINENANYGLRMKLNNEVKYNDREFVSSYNTSYPAMRPKLIITYK